MSEKRFDFIGGHCVVPQRLFLNLGNSLHGRYAEFFLNCRNIGLVLIEDFLGIGDAFGRCLRLLRLKYRSCRENRRVCGEHFLEIIESLLIVTVIALEFHPIVVVRRHSACFLDDIHNAVLFEPNRRKCDTRKRCVVLKSAA